jgi:quinol monooxygenase YgiN
MIIVTGRVKAQPATLAKMRELCLEHVHRSRTEPGCLLHAVHHDVEDPLTMVFLEHWLDRAALDAHFRVPASSDFVTAVTALSAEPPTIQIYEAELVR